MTGLVDVPHRESSTQLQGWIELQIDKRIADSLLKFREGELASVLNTIRSQATAAAQETGRSCDRLEGVVTSIASAQSRQLAVVEELSQELARAREAAASTAFQDEILSNIRQLSEVVEELRNSASSGDVAAARTAANLELFNASLKEVRSVQQDEAVQRDVLTSSIELLSDESEKQRTALVNVQDWLQQFQAGQLANMQEQLDELIKQMIALSVTKSSPKSTRAEFNAACDDLKESVSIAKGMAKHGYDSLLTHLETSHDQLSRGLTSLARQLIDELRREAWEVLSDHASAIEGLRAQQKSTDQCLGLHLAESAQSGRSPRAERSRDGYSVSEASHCNSDAPDEWRKQRSSSHGKRSTRSQDRSVSRESNEIRGAPSFIQARRGKAAQSLTE